MHNKPVDNTEELELVQRQKMTHIVNINNDLSDENNLKKTFNTNRNQKKTIRGTCIEKSDITAVESRKYVFISRLHPNTTCEQLKSHMKRQNLIYQDAEKLTIKSENISAFKVAVKLSKEKEMYNSDKWPQHTIIRPYRQSKNSQVSRNSKATL